MSINPQQPSASLFVYISDALVVFLEVFFFLVNKNQTPTLSPSHLGMTEGAAAVGAEISRSGAADSLHRFLLTFGGCSGHTSRSQFNGSMCLWRRCGFPYAAKWAAEAGPGVVIRPPGCQATGTFTGYHCYILSSPRPNSRLSRPGIGRGLFVGMPPWEHLVCGSSRNQTQDSQLVSQVC